jgi:UDP-glucuronate decarboxylase
VEEYWGNVNTLGPRSCYDEGKRVAETMCYAYHTECGVQVRLARIFNTFGPRMDPEDGRVVSNFIIQALTGKPITIYGDGSQTRSFQFVSDLIQGLLALMAGDSIGPINLGNPEEWTVKQFAEYIQARVNPDAPIVYQPSTADDPRKRRPDITRAQRVLGWKPRVDARDGLDKTIAYFKSELGMLRSGVDTPTIWMPLMGDKPVA